MLLFDAPDRERCVVRREQTHTPLQALVLLNDPTFVEASRGMAVRALRADLRSNADVVKFLFGTVLTRSPAEDEVRVLESVFHQQRRRFAADGEAAKKLLQVGASRASGAHDRAELAAWTVVSSVILNLDESIHK